LSKSGKAIDALVYNLFEDGGEGNCLGIVGDWFDNRSSLSTTHGQAARDATERLQLALLILGSKPFNGAD
jgi:hypothetical protein